MAQVVDGSGGNPQQKEMGKQMVVSSDKGIYEPVTGPGKKITGFKLATAFNELKVNPNLEFDARKKNRFWSTLNRSFSMLERGPDGGYQ